MYNIETMTKHSNEWRRLTYLLTLEEAKEYGFNNCDPLTCIRQWRIVRTSDNKVVYGHSCNDYCYGSHKCRLSYYDLIDDDRLIITHIDYQPTLIYLMYSDIHF